MILDKRNEFCDAVALNTGGAAAYQVGDILDLGATGMNIGDGEDIWLAIVVQTTATSGGSATGAFALITSDNSDLSSPTVVLTSPAIAVATLVAKYVILAVAIPFVDFKRYIGIQQTTAVAAFTAGKIDAFLTLDFAKWKPYADAVN